jgi:hypothetical protein
MMSGTLGIEQRPRVVRNLAPVVMVPIIYPAAVPPIIRPVTATVIDNWPVIIRRAVRVVTVRIVTVGVITWVSVKTDRESEPDAD